MDSPFFQNSIVDPDLMGQVKTAGKIEGPGIPDGTGPMRNDPSCPFNEGEEIQDEEQQEEKQAQVEDDAVEQVEDEAKGEPPVEQAETKNELPPNSPEAMDMVMGEKVTRIVERLQKAASRGRMSRVKKLASDLVDLIK